MLPRCYRPAGTETGLGAGVDRNPQQRIGVPIGSEGDVGVLIGSSPFARVMAQ
jgi:hypothetical protein